MNLSKEQIACMFLANAKLTVQNAEAIFEQYKSANNFYETFPNIPPNLITPNMKLLLMESKNNIEKNIESLFRNNVKILCRDDALYPQKLNCLEYKPYALFYKGNIDVLNKNSVAIVGTRNPSSYGKHISQEFAKSLGNNNVCVVSGFAMGVDKFAHEGAYSTIGGTAAVCGCGLAIDYPASNNNLRDSILENNGVLISEYDCDTVPLNYHFPNRNRIISALSDSVVFVEGKMKSGGMITVKYAQEQGKTVFSVPGNIGCELSEGPNKIIALGEARCASSVEDVLDSLNLDLISRQVTKIKNKDISNELSGIQLDIFNLLKSHPRSHGEIIEFLKQSPDLVQSAIAFLELLGYIKRSSGNYYEIDKGVY